MTVSFELLETYTGFRDVEVPGAEGEEPTTQQVPTNSVKVSFTDGTVTHSREVNVCFDENGAYDHDATLIRCEEVARGVEHKIAVGVVRSAEGV